MNNKIVSFDNIDANSCENVNYDVPELPIYVRDGNLSSLPNHTFKAHYHSDWEFIYVIDGKMKYSVNSQTIELCKGESLFVNSNHIHFGFSDAKEDCNYICLIVHPSLFAINPYIERNFISSIINSTQQYIVFCNDNDKEEIAKIIGDIFYRKQNKDKNFYFEIQQYLFALVYLTYCKIDKSLPVNTSRQDFSSVKTMMDFIAINYSEKITLSDIARSANMCNNNCILLFKQLTHSTPIAYLNNFRLDKALQLLRSSNKTILEIAIECGFSNGSYFTEYFRKVLGETPTEYRKQANTHLHI